MTDAALIALLTNAATTVPAAGPAVPRAGIATSTIVIAVVGTVVGLAAMAALRVFGQRSLADRPARLAPDDPPAALWMVAGLGFGAWLLAPSLLVAGFLSASPNAGGAATSVEAAATQPASALSPLQIATVINAAGAAGLAALFAALLSHRRNIFDQLGLSPEHLRRAIRPAALGAVAALPFVFGVIALTEILWRVIEYDFPGVHALLRAIREARDPLVTALVVVGATIMAPLFEELLFRGCVQTAALATLRRWNPRLDVAARWIAIVVASFAFTLVHSEAWMLPPIFALSLCLGYAYERTGNLWVPILLHAAFNGISTALFLGGL